MARFFTKISIFKQGRIEIIAETRYDYRCKVYQLLLSRVHVHLPLLVDVGNVSERMLRPVGYLGVVKLFEVLLGGLLSQVVSVSKSKMGLGVSDLLTALW